MNVDLEPDEAVRQACNTGQHYLAKAYDILMHDGYENWTVRDAIELAKVMAQDFHTTMTCVEMERTVDAIYYVANRIKEKSE